MTAVDQEYLFQHFHITMKRKGAEVDLSGLKNVKYEKFMSRPHVGQKLMVCVILEGEGFFSFFSLIFIYIYILISFFISGNKYFGSS